MSIAGNSLAFLLAFVESLTHTLPGQFPAISQTAGALLVTAIWQGAVVAACLALSLRLANRISAGLRFTLWTAGFLAVVTLPFLPPVLRLFAHTAPATTEFAASTPRFSLDFRWSIAICLLWTAVSLYRAVDLAAHTHRLRKLWLSATPVESAPVPSRLFGRRPIQLCTTDDLDRPSVIGFFAPRILIPSWLLPRLTPGELDQILLHETEHLRRGDDWTNLLQKLSLILFPLNPVLLWMERQLCLEREMACDEAVIRVTHAPRAYAQCLTTLAERGIEHRTQSSAALSLGAWHRRPELVHRVHSLLRAKPALNIWGTRALTAALASGLILGSVELARCPQLVAFVPPPSPESAHLSQPEPNRNLGNAREILTAWRQPAHPEPNAPAYRTELRAIAPNRAQSSPSFEANVRDSAAKIAALPTPHIAQDKIPDQLLLQAETPSTAHDPQQSWIVLTAWEEVAVQNQPETPASAAAGEASAQQSAGMGATPDPTSQITVTRMVFRVVPASFRSSTPTAVRTRDGWLVIQM